MKILAFDTCLDKTYITLAEDEKIVSIAQAQHEDEEEENTENTGAETSATPEEN